ncbi:unnamed protein product, partial [Discosporangium mesarthrocarpum]
MSAPSAASGGGRMGKGLDEETMQKLFDKVTYGGDDAARNKEFQISKEEAKVFRKAFADPTFRDMMRDYLDEMQDPERRAEQEEYISQLEEQNRVPEGKRIIHPKACFVVKTRFTRVSG